MSAARSGDWDEALTRLEEFLLTYPSGRTLPDPERIIAEADLPPGFLLEDERARKIILDALADRPLSSIERVAQLRMETEMLVVEVRMITERLHAGEAGPAESVRLGEIRARLDELRGLL